MELIKRRLYDWRLALKGDVSVPEPSSHSLFICLVLFRLVLSCIGSDLIRLARFNQLESDWILSVWAAIRPSNSLH